LNALKVKQGDCGFKIVVNHNSTNTVYYNINDGEDIPLVDNSYFIIESHCTCDKGTYKVNFVEKKDGLNITSESPFIFAVY
jgi:hypothetical protein